MFVHKVTNPCNRDQATAIADQLAAALDSVNPENRWFYSIWENSTQVRGVRCTRVRLQGQSQSVWPMFLSTAVELVKVLPQGSYKIGSWYGYPVLWMYYKSGSGTPPKPWIRIPYAFKVGQKVKVWLPDHLSDSIISPVDGKPGWWDCLPYEAVVTRCRRRNNFAIYEVNTVDKQLHPQIGNQPHFASIAVGPSLTYPDYPFKIESI